MKTDLVKGAYYAATKEGLLYRGYFSDLRSDRLYKFTGNQGYFELEDIVVGNFESYEKIEGILKFVSYDCFYSHHLTQVLPKLDNSVDIYEWTKLYTHDSFGGT